MNVALKIAPLFVGMAGWFLSLGAAMGGSWALLTIAGLVGLGGQVLVGTWLASRAETLPGWSVALAGAFYWKWVIAFLGDLGSPAGPDRALLGMFIYFGAGVLSATSLWAAHRAVTRRRTPPATDRHP